MTLDADTIADRLHGLAKDWEVKLIAETPSTNSTLADWAQRGAQGPLALLTEKQTEGRGRRGRQWQTMPGESLIASLLLRPETPPDQWHLVTLATGVALAEAILPIAPVRLKWPNDLILDGEKLGGILVETQITSGGGFLIIGFGININQQAFPDELNAIATSLHCHSGHTLDLNTIAAATLNALAERIPQAWNNPSSILQRFAELDGVSGPTVTAIEREAGEEIHGTASGVDGRGRLILQLPAGGFRTLEDAWSIRWDD